MLPKSRIVSVIILGIGSALAAAGLLFPHVVVTDARMPLSLEQTTMTLVDPNGTQRSNVDGSMYVGPMTKQYHSQVVPPIEDDLATARVGVSLMRGDNNTDQTDLDRLIEATLWTYSFERKSGINTSSAKVVDTPATGAADVAFSGYWVKFPTDAERTSYDVFEPTLRRTAPAVFQDASERNGRTIYRYRQEIPPTNVAELYHAMFNTVSIQVEPPAEEPAAENPEGEIPAEEAPPEETPEGEEPAAEESAEPETITGMLFHSGFRDFYVDQISGMIVDMEENTIDYYGDVNGEKLADARLFAGKVDDAQAAGMLAQVEDLQDGSIPRTIAWVVFGIGCVLSLLGLAGCFRFGRKR